MTLTQTSQRKNEEEDHAHQDGQARKEPDENGKWAAEAAKHRPTPPPLPTHAAEVNELSKGQGNEELRTGQLDDEGEKKEGPAAPN